MENNVNKPGGSNGSNRILIILLALSLILNFYQWQNKKTVVQTFENKVETMSNEKQDVYKELSETIDELNQYKGINSRLDSLLSEANGNIDKQKERIQQLLKNEKNSAALNQKLKAELEDLRKMRDEYLDKIDQLLIENAKLKEDNSSLTATVNNLSTNLEKTINTASVLKAEYVTVKSFKKRSNDKYVETAMAKRTNKIDVTFSVMENKIAKAGERNVYLRIVEPGGKTLGDRSAGSSTFKLMGSGEDVQYTSTTKLNFDNTKQDLTMSWDDAQRNFTPGNYTVEIYFDGMLGASSSFILK